MKSSIHLLFFWVGGGGGEQRKKERKENKRKANKFKKIPKWKTNLLQGMNLRVNERDDTRSFCDAP